MPTVHSWLLRLWRLFALCAAGWLLHVAAEKQELATRSASISIDQAKRFFPPATRVTAAVSTNGLDEVYDSAGRLLGYAAMTSPQADSVIGYTGPNNVLVGLNPAGKIVGVDLLSSADTTAHINEVKSDKDFWSHFLGWAPARESAPHIDGVAGSTLTSLGIAEAVQKRFAGKVESLRFPEPVNLSEVRSMFPAAAEFHEERDRGGWFAVMNSRGEIIGFVVRTAPFSDYTHGHSGPTESLVGLAVDRKTLIGVRLRKSYDTDDYVDSVREDVDYLKQLTGFSVDQWATMDLKSSGLEGVSGATETSFAVAEGIHRRFAADAARAGSTRFKVPRRDIAVAAIVFGSIVMTFTSLRGRRSIRLIWQAILIGIFGLVCGDLLSLALLAGWMRHGVTWNLGWSLVLVAAVSLLVPWTTGRQIYCYELCPHGAAQEWLGRFKKLHLRVPPGLARYLSLLPAILLCLAFWAGLLFAKFDLSRVEPFDAWALRGAAIAATVIAVAGLVVSLFVPMAYCRYGCPTGALLRFVRSVGSGDRFGRRDVVAAAILVGGAFFVYSSLFSFAEHRREDHSVVLNGKCFGTTWSVKLRQMPPNPADLERRLSAELERIESTLSHWRSNSATSQFNAARTTQPMEFPPELVTLVARCLEISRASDGAYDITVAPLVQAWGFGPGGEQAHAPSETDIARLRSVTGWQNLTADTNANTLRKNVAGLQIDLGSILQGYAADRLSALLQASGQTNFIIDVGGELLARGRWTVGIEDPYESGHVMRSVQLEDCALATSGVYKAKKREAKKEWSHLIDPKTGQPVHHDTVLVSVVSKSCGNADAWATALIVTGGNRAVQLASRNQLGAFVVTRSATNSVAFPSRK